MANYSTVVFGGITLNITALTPSKKQKTRKQVIGKTLAQNSIIGLQGQDWSLSLNGVVLGTTTSNLSANRASIEALDDVATHTFTDGIHNGTYYMVPGSLQFDDSGERGNISYVYSFNLIEE